MKLFIRNTMSKFWPSDLKLDKLEQTSPLEIFATRPDFEWSDGSQKVYFFGNVSAVRDDSGVLDAAFTTTDLQNAMLRSDAPQTIEGRFLMLRVLSSGELVISSDNFGQIDIYYQDVGEDFFVATSLDLLPIWQDPSAKIDPVAISQAVEIYGGRPLKRHTGYQGVRRLGVGDRLELCGKNRFSISRKQHEFKPRYDYDLDAGLNKYADLFVNSVTRRADSKENIILLSSGWDSSSILATLVHSVGKDAVKPVIGRMKYSDQSGVCNQFEIDRATQMADYFDLPLDIVDLDYRDEKTVSGLIERLRRSYKSHQFCAMTGFNHWLLAEASREIASEGAPVFAGEMSDGAHNLGFSQYVTVFHPNSQGFREYSDKMATYLFGPTFLDVLIKGEQDRDPAWQFLTANKPAEFFEDLQSGERNVREQFLKSFFLRGGRMPLAAVNSPLLTEHGMREFDEQSFVEYFQHVIDAFGSDNHYALLLEFYNSFHWQGSTVATLYHACAENGLKCEYPFLDSDLLNFLSFMPEDWGRGLELRPTKFPLKWMLENRIDYPYELQSGFHSYTYDVDPNFSHLNEIINHSGFNKVFKETLATGRYKKIFAGSFFDHGYIEHIVTSFLDGEEVPRADQVHLMNISMQSLLGPGCD